MPGQRRVGISETNAPGVIIDGGEGPIDLNTPVGVNINGASLGASHAHSGAYEALQAVRWIGSESWTFYSGSVASADHGGQRLWGFDAAGTEIIASSVLLPGSWATYTAKLLWCNSAAGAGDVVWRLDVSQTGTAAGETISVPTGTPVTATAGGQLVAVETTLITGAAITADEPLYLRIARTGAAGADTLANDAAVIGLSLVKAS